MLGGEGAGWGATERLLDRAAVLFAWEQVGLADAAMIQARDYAMGRYAFGRAIASYQAIKHKLANMYVKNTLARSNCYYGAWALNTDSAELPLAAATARVGAIKAAVFRGRGKRTNPRRHGIYLGIRLSVLLSARQVARSKCRQRGLLAGPFDYCLRAK